VPLSPAGKVSKIDFVLDNGDRSTINTVNVYVRRVIVSVFDVTVSDFRSVGPTRFPGNKAPLEAAQ
jgi:hypothetical protein